MTGSAEAALAINVVHVTTGTVTVCYSVESLFTACKFFACIPG